MSVRAPYEGHYKENKLASIVLPIDPDLFGALSEVMHWGGVDFSKKEELHVTLIRVQHASELSGRSPEEIASFFNSFVEDNPIILGSLLNDLRQATEGGNKTILVRCTAQNLDELFAALNRTFGIAVPVQPAHITLYSVEHNKGIHVNSDAKMESLEHVDLPEFDEALRRLHL
ncbi:hypothetical protein HY414_01580 [Candidatus Kaiserbacteria bacterium]|nr:hypothetical protein [Candidatus Kaiserbacteria bacterium]